MPLADPIVEVWARLSTHNHQLDGCFLVELISHCGNFCVVVLRCGVGDLLCNGVNFDTILHTKKSKIAQTLPPHSSSLT